MDVKIVIINVFHMLKKENMNMMRRKMEDICMKNIISEY